jgi:hypothetical protein
MMMVMVIFNVISHIKFHLQSDIMYINSNSHKLKVYCKFIIHFDTASVVLSFMCSPQVWQIVGKSLTHIFYALESYSFHTCWMARNHVNLIIRVNVLLIQCHVQNKLEHHVLHIFICFGFKVVSVALII